MLASDKHVDSAPYPAVRDDMLTCSCCGSELKSQRLRVRNESEAYCRVCYARMMFPDLREADMEFLD